jgi:hypothetical protein
MTAATVTAMTMATATAATTATAMALAGSTFEVEYGSVIDHGYVLSLSIAKWRNLLNSQLLVYNVDRQAPPDLSNPLPEETDLDPETWLTRHELMLTFLRRIANASIIQPDMFP